MRLIDADWLSEAIHDNVPAPYEDASWAKENCLAEIDAAPTIDAVPVVRCDSCVLEGNCFAESNFRLAGIENPFCCAGKLMKLSDTERKCDD